MKDSNNDSKSWLFDFNLVYDQSEPSPSKCFLCEEEFAVGSSGRDAFLSHCISLHKMVIGDVHLISDLESYVAHWRERFKQGALTDFCVSG